MISYIEGYSSGECTLLRIAELGDRLANIEVFAAEKAFNNIYVLNDDFIRDMGFEANFSVRPVSDAQCPLIGILDQVGAAALDNSLEITLERDQIPSGASIKGKIKGGVGAQLHLYDNLGGITDLSGSLRTVNGETGFDIPINGQGPQVLIAAKARDGSGVDPNARIEALLGAAQRGEAALALGFFELR